MSVYKHVRCYFRASHARLMSVTTASSMTATKKRACQLYKYDTLVPYATAWGWQQSVINHRIASEPPESTTATSTPLRKNSHKDMLIVLQHPHVYTLGRGAAETDLLVFRDAPADAMQRWKDTPRGQIFPFPLQSGKDLVSVRNNGSDAAISDARSVVELMRVERGGKITYHGPGQVVAYPLLDLTHHKKDLHWYVATIEEVIINVLAAYGISSARYKGYPGVWVGEEKVAQVGMNCSKWFTTHGFAINVCPDMTYFQHIVPCGISDKQVTSMSRLLGRSVCPDEVADRIVSEFSRCFNVDIYPADVHSEIPAP